MFKKGDWVLHSARRQKMRVQRDYAESGPDGHLIWCEWENGGYHLETHYLSELEPLPPSQWPDDL